MACGAPCLLGFCSLRPTRKSWWRLPSIVLLPVGLIQYRLAEENCSSVHHVLHQPALHSCGITSTRLFRTRTLELTIFVPGSFPWA